MSNVECRIGDLGAVLEFSDVHLEADLKRGTFRLEHNGETILPATASGVTFVSGKRVATDAMSSHRAEIVDEGAALQIEHRTDEAGPVLIQRFRRSSVAGGVEMELVLCAGGDALAVDRLHHLVMACSTGEASAFEPGGGLWMWRHGTVSPGDPVLLVPLDSPDIPETHDRYRWFIEDDDRLGFTSEMLVSFRSFRSGRTCFLGFTTVADQACGFLVTRRRDVFDHVSVESRCDIEGMTVAPGEEVRAETRSCLRAGAPGGGFILSSSNSIHSAVKPGNYLAMLQTLREYGRYPITA